MMAEQIYHNDFNFIEEISSDDLKKADKMRMKKTDYIYIVSCTLMLIVFIVMLVSHVPFLENYIILMFCLSCVFIIAIRVHHLLYGSAICGLSYGIVKNKQTKDKLMSGHTDGLIYPWYKDDYDRSMDKPMLSSVKTFYYVDVSMCNMDGYMEHICCYKDDFEKLKEGDKVILIRFRNDFLIAVPASDSIT